MKNTLKIARKILRKIFSIIPPFNKRVVVFMDGGICSQINQYIIGQLIAQNDYDVYYDTSFYVKDGLDGTGKFVRNFDLLKLFPDLNFKKTKPLQSLVWSKVFRRSKQYANSDFDYLSEKAPFYLAGYYGVPNAVYQNYTEYLPKIDIDRIIKDEANRKYTSQIANCEKSCGVHVRRGDLAEGNIHYGEGTSNEYFINAIEYVRKSAENTHFFFFSDEIDYVEKEILPLLDAINYTLITGNGSDKGYIDLALCSLCDIQIASVGSMGKYAALLKGSNRQIILPSTPECSDWAKRINGEAIIIEN